MFRARADDVWNAACEIPGLSDLKRADLIGHDFDFGAPPILTTVPGGSQVVLAGDKGGVVFCLDAHTGAMRWTRRVGKGSALGGIHFGMATDGNRLYVPVTDTYADKTSVSTNGLPALGADGPQVGPVAEGSPGIYALDLRTGEEIWYIRPTHEYHGARYTSVYSAAVSLTNDILLAGSLDGEIVAVRTSDGQELSRFDSDIPLIDVAGNSGDSGAIDLGCPSSRRVSVRESRDPSDSEFGTATISWHPISWRRLRLEFPCATARYAWVAAGSTNVTDAAVYYRQPETHRAPMGKWAQAGWLPPSDTWFEPAARML
ncbi:outer membrane protein assembly factor BamB family protein [Nocardia noduli]|uniref:outer membrane protein assembly factor BamB family protein n=1 Tax=Nocardia noduli TaxID=2815722 RepID=UPI001C230E73|nr:PQQ-binding-like beta-propeller repeat protein [Nocardia noduli]